LLAAAAPSAEPGFVGCVPDAELHVFKALPGGRLSDLLAALDECIAREVDVVCLNVATDEGSELLAQKLYEVRHKGIACIVAAGTSAAASGQFPAVLPSVLAVGAIGKLGTFPSDSCHARAVTRESIGNDGVFPATFTGIGPHVALCAPGVAVLSAVPGGGYAALDGTGAAAALVTGMATLILAHHPFFQGPMKTRSEQRVDTLFNLLRVSATPQFADPLRGGVGVPSLKRVPGLAGVHSETGGLFATPYDGAAGLSATGPTRMDPFVTGWPRIGPAWVAPPDWGLLMQMRTAGLL
jgi:subtilisin family serine protease